MMAVEFYVCCLVFEVDVGVDWVVFYYYGGGVGFFYSFFGYEY